MTPTRRSTFLLPLLALSLTPAGSALARKAYPIRPVKPVIASHAQCLPLKGLVLDMAAQNAINSVYYYPYYFRRGLEATADAKAAPAAGGPGHHTGTNNQEAGIDEGDIVKTDGRFVYTIRNREVVITRAWPTRSMRVVARYALPKNVTPSQLQLRGNRLVILSNVWEPSDDQEAADSDRLGAYHIRPYSPPKFSGTRITVLDIRKRTNPRLISETDIEGWLSQTRLIGNELYLVSNSSLRVPDLVAKLALARAKKLPAMKGDVYNWEERNKLREKGLKVVRAYLAKRFRNLDLSSAMPRTRSRWAATKMTALQAMYSCDQLTIPGGDAKNGIVNVSSINLFRPTTVRSAGVTGNGWQVYASSAAVYVAMPEYGMNDNGEYKNSTKILKFALRSWHNDGPAFAGAGSVQGHLLNQFAMSEHNGFLRVMTTDQQWGRGGRVEEAANNLFVMRSRGQRLRVIGKVTGLAKGERVFAARMFGDKGYMVTFRQTDPLFTFDLSNPYAPKMVGELKINGFSSYIHPIDGDRLLTIGRDADDDGRVKGLHLQIFDVSNPAKPIRTHQEILEGGRYSYSAAQWDHHAFTFDPVTGTLALPISGYLEGGYGYNNYYSGLEVFKVGKRGIDYQGYVSHNDYTNGESRWSSQISRSMIIGKMLVSVSNVGITATSLKNLKTVGSVLFAEAKPLRLKATVLER